MKNIFLFGIVASVLVLGCSDPVKPDADSSSSGGSSEVKSSSSVVASSSSQVKSSSSGTVQSSSSVVSSSSSAKSSSSIASSSSQAKSSSSGTVQSSSSVVSSSSNAKSSSSVATSSSSQPKSSSSYKTQDDIPFGGINIVYDSIYDPRDNHKYLYSTYTGWDGTAIRTYTIMVQNLDYSEVITLGAEEQDDDTKVEKYCYNDQPQNCDFYGGLYQWAEMMALPYECNTISCAHLIQEQHQGICPDGWHLITNPEIRAAINSTDEGIEGVKAGPYWTIGGGMNTSGFTLLGGGKRYRDATYKDLNQIAHWYFPTEYEKIVARARSGYISGYDNVFSIDNSYNSKVDGYSIRCVKNY